jgi:hypothetical protein
MLDASALRHCVTGIDLQDDAPHPDENAVPPPLDAVSDVDSHDLSEIADLDDAEGHQAGSDDEGEDLMDNLSGYAPPSCWMVSNCFARLRG